MPNKNKRLKSLKRKTSKRSGQRLRKSIRKYRRHSSRRKSGGGSYGSDIRQELVTNCRRNNWNQYNALIENIINDYRANKGRSEFFNHLNNQIHTFSPQSLNCLKPCLIQLNEQGISDAIPYLYYILYKNNEKQEYDALTQKIMYDYRMNRNKNYFIYLDNNIEKLNKVILPSLLVSLTQLQEDAIPESMRHLSYVRNEA